VHPNKAFSFFGSPYLEPKFLSYRIENEAKYYRTVAKWLFIKGARIARNDKTLAAKPFEHRFNTETKGRSVKVENLEAAVTIPPMSNDYPLFGMRDDGSLFEMSELPKGYNESKALYRYAQNRARELSYSYGPRINAICRSIELAFFKYGFYGKNRKYGNEIKPGWPIPEWERDWKFSFRSKEKWNALNFNEKVTLAYRLRKTSVKTPF
jgi:hypothetical protein